MNDRYIYESEAQEEWQKLQAQSVVLPRVCYLGAILVCEEYQHILAYTKAAACHEDIPQPDELAIRLLTIFGREQDAINYLTNAGRRFSNSKQPIHDACLFTLPTEVITKDRLKIWQQLTRKYVEKPGFLALLPVILSMEKKYSYTQAEKEKLQELNSEEGKIVKELRALKKQASSSNVADFEEQKQKLIEKLDSIKLKKKELHDQGIHADSSLQGLLQKANQLKYMRYQEAPETANWFLKYHVPEKEFNEYLDLDKSQAGENLPNLMLDGNEIGYPGFYFKKLNRNDPRAAILGELTGCCQSIHGVYAEYCRFGLTHENAGFYVLCKGDAQHPHIDDLVYAQSLAWVGTVDFKWEDFSPKMLVFDSIEFSQSVSDVRHRKMYKDFYDEAGRRLITQPANQEKHIELIGVGIGGQTPLGIGFSIQYSLNMEKLKSANYPIVDSENITILAANSNEQSNKVLNEIKLYQQVYRRELSLADLDQAMTSVPDTYKNHEHILQNIIMISILNGQFELVDALLKREIHLEYHFWESILAAAVFQEDPLILQYAFMHGASVSKRTVMFGPSVLDGIMHNKREPSIEIMRVLIKQYGIKNVFFSQDTDFCFKEFIVRGWQQTLAFLLKEYPEYIPYLNFIDSSLYGESLTLFEWAEIAGQTEMQQLLKEYHVDAQPCYLLEKEHEGFVFLPYGHLGEVQILLKDQSDQYSDDSDEERTEHEMSDDELRKHILERYSDEVGYKQQRVERDIDEDQLLTIKIKLALTHENQNLALSLVEKVKEFNISFIMQLFENSQYLSVTFLEKMLKNKFFKQNLNLDIFFILLDELIHYNVKYNAVTDLIKYLLNRNIKHLRQVIEAYFKNLNKNDDETNEDCLRIQCILKEHLLSHLSSSEWDPDWSDLINLFVHGENILFNQLVTSKLEAILPSLRQLQVLSYKEFSYKIEKFVEFIKCTLNAYQNNETMKKYCAEQFKNMLESWSSERSFSSTSQQNRLFSNQKDEQTFFKDALVRLSPVFEEIIGKGSTPSLDC